MKCKLNFYALYTNLAINSLIQLDDIYKLLADGIQVGLFMNDKLSICSALKSTGKGIIVNPLFQVFS